MSPERHDFSIRLAQIPDLIGGYGPVKKASVEKAMAEEARLRAAMAAAKGAPRAALAAE